MTLDPANLPDRQRRRMYAFAAAVVGLLALKGLVSGDEAQAWLLLLVPVLDVARRKVPPLTD